MAGISTKFGVLARTFATSSAARHLVKPPVSAFGLDGRYATALYSAATKQKQLNVVEKDLNEFAGLWKTDVQLRELLLNPLLNKALKKEAINFVSSKKKCSPLTTNLLIAMAENGRLKMLPAVISTFNTFMAAERGEVVCEVTTAKALDSAMQKEVEATLKLFLKKGQSIKLNTKVDPAIIGGMVVLIGDKYVDMSMASKYNKYAAALKEAM